jgi:hypothetical protein
MSTKVLTLQGVPYVVNTLTQDVSMYGIDSSPIIGKLSDDKKSVILFPDWQTKADAALTTYRQILKQTTQEAMNRATDFHNKN